MLPTYSTTEILDFICLLDIEELEILSELVIEEQERYSITEIQIIYANVSRQAQRLVIESTGKVLENVWKWKT